MKLVYALSTSLLASLFFLSASAQPFPGGTYTAVRSGSWVAPPGPNFVWDVSGQPPAVCNACNIIISSGAHVTLNASIELKGNSLVQIGTLPDSAASILIPASGAANFSTGNNVLMDYDGVNTGSTLSLFDKKSEVDATAASEYDGILSSNNSFLKLVGNAPGDFNAAGAVLFPIAALDGNVLTGPSSVSSSTILPVTLMNFDAEAEKNAVRLSWQTAEEDNSDYFAVQRLSDAGAWETIGKLNAQGSSSVTVDYSFSDANPLSGINQYRLESVDRDGKYAYSEVKIVHVGALSTVSVFPNPASDYVNITLSGTATGTQDIQLVSQTGQLLAERKLNNEAGNTVQISVSNYPQGNYLLLIIGADGSRQVSKLFVSHK